jgi:hypothetical protein
MAAASACITVQVDWQNAFNFLRRDKMLAAVEQRCSALLPMVVCAYGRHNYLLVHQFPGAVVSSQSRVQQGDLLGCCLPSLCKGHSRRSQKWAGPDTTAGVRTGYLPTRCPSIYLASLRPPHRLRSSTQPPCAACKVHSLLRGLCRRRLGRQPPGRVPRTGPSPGRRHPR